MPTALDVRIAKSVLKKANEQKKLLLAAYQEILNQYLQCDNKGSLEIYRYDDNEIVIRFCAGRGLGFKSLTIYQFDVDTKRIDTKKKRILDYLSGKIDYLEKPNEHL